MILPPLKADVCVARSSATMRRMFDLVEQGGACARADRGAMANANANSDARSFRISNVHQVTRHTVATIAMD